MMFSRPKIHIYGTQFDDGIHPMCGRGRAAVHELQFEATESRFRCRICERMWFPNGRQPSWHFEHSRREHEKESMLRPLYIFDLDGTMALIDHRRHHLEDKTNPRRHDLFHMNIDQDLPNEPVIKVMHALQLAGNTIWIFSARRNSTRAETVRWLSRHTVLPMYNIDLTLTMRPEGDHRPDEELKEMYLKSMLDVDRERLVGVFDDRQRVVNMWRRNGVRCFQVAPGDF